MDGHDKGQQPVGQQQQHQRQEGVPEVNLGGVKCHFISANENNNLSMCESMVESNKNGHWHNN